MLEAVNVSAEVVAAILGIAITVVAIIVQLAATRYNHHITEMFIREPANIVVQGFFVITTLLCIWIAALGDGETGLSGAVLVMVTIALVGLLPYFGYVFTFISPLNIIRRIRRQGEQAIRDGRRTPASRAIDELQDVARSAIDQGDRAIALACVTALTDLFRHYREHRARLPDDWFVVTDAIREDPDFVALEPSAMEELRASRLWVEMKILQQFLNIMRMSVSRMHDVAGSLGIALRHLALEHLQDHRVLNVMLRAFNSFLRASLNARDARTSYHVLSQYRFVAEALLKTGNESAALEAAGHMQRYGQLAYTMGQPFILEVTAFDLAELIKTANDMDSGAVEELLAGFLELDHEIKYEAQEDSLLGVRRAQLQVGAYFLAKGDQARARRIADDLRSERPERLRRVHTALLGDQPELFWEFTPRGVNFAFLGAEYRPHLDRLMVMVGAAPEGVRAP